MKTLALIHTVSGIIPAFQELCKEILHPQFRVFHLVDESILQNLIRVGKLSSHTYRKVSEYVVQAEEGGADAVLVTCSSISPCVEVAKYLVSIPVLKIDEPMAEETVKLGSEIGIVATLRTTLEPTINLIKQKATERGKKITVETSLCQGAFEAVVAGDGEKHDEIVKTEIGKLRTKVEVIVLAQASMARLIPGLGESEIPILSSPKSGLLAAKRVLEKL